VRKLRPRKKPAPSLQTPDWGPGKMAESDWSPYTIPYTSGLSDQIELFSYVLPYSTRKFYQDYDSYGVHALMDGHAGAFNRFGGCAEVCKYDGQRAVARWEGTQPIYNPQFLAFCTHYQMRPWAIRGNPNDRPRVERGFWEFERSFLNGRSFRDRMDFRFQLRHWLDTVVDQRRRNGTTALERFAQEAPHLIPLPRHPYDTARVIYRLCDIEGFVHWQGNYYAVPYDHVTDWLPVRITQAELFVYAADLKCIARHALAPRGAGQKIDPQQLHRRRARQAAVDLDQLQQAYTRMGEHAARFFAALSTGPARKWSAAARQILLLRQRYATSDLDKALGHAAAYGALSFASVERILTARHPPRTLDEYVAAQSAQRLESLGGTTHCRDLSEYDQLPDAPHQGSIDASSATDKELAACQNASTEPEEPTNQTPLQTPESPPQQNKPPQTTCSSHDCDNTSTSSD